MRMKFDMPRPSGPNDPDYAHALRKYPCASSFEVEVEDGIVTYLKINGGCEGNRTAVERLVVGRPVVEVIECLRDIKCGCKVTSCPAEIARALETM